MAGLIFRRAPPDNSGQARNVNTFAGSRRSEPPAPQGSVRAEPIGDEHLATATTVEPTRRDFLYIATGAVAAVGAAAVVWPLISQMSPDASTLAMASTEVDIGAIPEGQIVTIKWRGKPVFIRHRTAQEIASAEKIDCGDPAGPAAQFGPRAEAAMADRGRRLHPSRLHPARPRRRI